jgi:hypothetical protein
MESGGSQVKRFLGISLVLLTACAGDAPPGTVLTGTWTGTATTVFRISGGAVYVSTLEVFVENGVANISGFCPDGSGSVAAAVSTVGTGTFASFVGTAACPASRLGTTCASVSLTYTTIGILAGNDNGPVLSFSGNGLSDGCRVPDQLQTTLLARPASP